MGLVDLRQTGTGQHGVRFGSKLLAKLGYLATGAAVSDYRPTNQHVEVQAILGTELMQHVAAIDAVLQAELAPFNQQLRARNLPEVVDRNGAPRRIIP